MDKEDLLAGFKLFFDTYYNNDLLYRYNSISGKKVKKFKFSEIEEEVLDYAKELKWSKNQDHDGQCNGKFYSCSRCISDIYYKEID